MAEEVTLKVNVQTGEAVNNLGKLEKATKDVTSTVDKTGKGTQTLQQRLDAFNKEVKETPVNVRAMNKQIQEYQAIALEAGRTSPVGKAALKQAAQMKDRYIDIQNEVNRLANDGMKMQAALDLGTSVVAGYSAFQGAMALAGVESEELQATLVKLQAAQSLLMGVEVIRKNLEKESTLVLQAKTTAEKVSIGVTKLKTFVTTGATTATKLLRLALLSLPFVAIGVAIAAVIQNFDKLKSALGGVSKRQKMLNETMESYEKGVKSAIQETNEMKATFDLAKSGVISKEEALEKYNTTLGDSFGKAKNLNEAEQLFVDKTDAYIKAQGLRAQASALFEKAAEEQTNTIVAGMEDQRNVGEKAVGWLNNAVASVIDYSTAGFTDLSKVSEDFNSKVNKQKTEQVKKDSETRATAFEQLATDLLKEATLIENENAIISEGADEINKKKKELRKQRLKLEKQAIYDLTLAQKQADAEEITDAKLKADELIKIEQFKLEHALKDKKLTDSQRELLEFQTQQTIDKIKEKFAKIDLDRQATLNKQLAKEYNDLLMSVEDLENDHFNRITEDQQKNQQIEINAVYDKYNAQIEALRLRGESTKILEEAQAADIAEINDKYRQQEMEKDMAIQDAKYNMASQSLGALQELTTAFAKDNEKSQKRAFEINKKLQIAQALIQTFQGANAIFASAAANPKSILFPAQPFIMAGLAIASGLANVANISKQQFSGGSASGGGGTPNLNVTGGGQAPQLSPVTNTSTITPQEPTQVFVTETDITNTQNKVAVIEDQATIK